jgi:hypothetical protein
LEISSTSKHFSGASSTKDPPDPQYYLETLPNAKGKYNKHCYNYDAVTQTASLGLWPFAHSPLQL